MTLLLQVAVVVAVARATGRVFLRLGQPEVIGEMTAGLLLGPSFFGWLLPGPAAALFAPHSLTPLNSLSQLGMVLFMFLVGLRVDLGHLIAHRRVAALTSLTSIVAPFVLGGLLALHIHDRLAPPGVARLPFTLFVGSAMSITAFPVLARILVDRGLVRTDVGTIALACAAFDDVSGWMIVAGVATIVRSGDAWSLAVRTLGVAAYLAVMVAIVRPALRRLVDARASSGAAAFGASSDDLAVALLVTLLSAMTTEALGIHALFGAFFAGLMMPRRADVEMLLRERIEPLTLTVLLPLFFALIGLRTRVQLIDSATLWMDALLIIIVAVVGKGVASALAAWLMGIGWRNAAALGVLLNTRGLIELVILNIGLELGVLSPVLFSMMVLMALLTTFVASPIVAALVRPGAVTPRLSTQSGDRRLTRR